MRAVQPAAIQPKQQLPAPGQAKCCRPTHCASGRLTSRSYSHHDLCWHVQLARLAAAGVCTATLLVGGTAAAQDQPGQQHTIQACKPGTSCVSTSSFMSPSQYLPPWSFKPLSRDDAYRRLLQELQAAGAKITEEDTEHAYIAADLAFTTTFGQQISDHIEVVLRQDNVALFRSQAASSTPDPPFCFTRGCISGPRNRVRMEQFRDERLGWSPMETDEDKQWVQILLH